jgi:hypothetical protein
MPIPDTATTGYFAVAQKIGSGKSMSMTGGAIDKDGRRIQMRVQADRRSLSTRLNSDRIVIAGFAS